MPPIRANEFLDCTLRSKLVSAQQLRDELQQLRSTDPKSAGDARAIAKHLVAAQLITGWQAKKLLKGRYRGFQLGNYRLLDQLGQGGMSMVYLGEHLRMRRKVAIKVLPKSRVKDPLYLDRFLVEARAAAALAHPNIVRAYDFDSEGDTHFLVMECLDGQTLDELVRSGHPLPIDDIVRYLSQAATGLQHAHEEGLIHRDIKPANLMVTPDGQLKVLDMGLARLSQSADDSASALEKQHAVMGTADYLAPEQALNSHQVDRRADVYSLGCTLYFTLTGQPPFPDGNVAQKIASHQTVEAPPVTNHRSDCPAALAQLCHEMMAKQPDQRIPSMEEVLTRLAGVEVFGLPTHEPVPLPTALRPATNEPAFELGSEPNESAAGVVDGWELSRSTTSTRPNRRLKTRRSVPFWIWIAIAALIAVAIWLGGKIRDQGGFGF